MASPNDDLRPDRRALAESPRRHPFVGRTRELDVLQASLSAAIRGTGGVVLLVGEPGIGKTRTAEELARRARAEGAEVLLGRCYEGEGAPAFWPWVQVLRSYVAARDASTLAAELDAGAPEVAALCPDLSTRLPDLHAPLVLDGEAARFRMFDSVTRTFSRAAAVRPLVLMLDDLHGADKSSLLLLQFLARALREMPVLVVGGLRRAALAREHPLAETLGELVREQVVEQLGLSGLEEAEVAELLAEMMGTSPPPGLASAVRARTEGNPLYVREVARTLAAAGDLAANWAGGRIEIPDTVRLAIARNLRVLSSDCHELLTLASLFGREFRVEALTRASGLAPPLVLALLDEAEAARIVEQPSADGNGSRRFAHALFGESLTNALGSAARTAQHRRAAEALAGNPRAEEHAAEIAHHWKEAGPAGDLDQAVAWARRAAERALGLLAHEEAARLYRMALTAADQRPEPEARQGAELWLGLGEACRRAGEASECKRAFLEAAGLARRLASPELLTRAALGYAPALSYAEQTEPDTAVIRLLDEAIATWGGRDSGLHACAQARLALALFFGDRAKRTELCERALTMARRLGDPPTLRYVLAAWLSTYSSRYDPELRLAAATELVQLAEEANDPEALAVGRLWRAVHLLEFRGDGPGMRREHAGLARLATELRQPVWSWYGFVTEGTDALFDGRFGDAERAFGEAFRIGQQALPWAARTYFVGSMMFLRALQGRAGEFADEYRSLSEVHPVHGAISPLVWVESERGNTAEARRIIERLTGKGFSYLAKDFEFFVSAWFIAEGCVRLGDLPRAARLYEYFAPLASRWVVWAEAIPLGPASHVLGVLARTLGRLDQAARHFEDALAATARTGAKPFLARTQFEYAVLLQKRDGGGDGDRAAELLAEARTLSESVGMAGLLAKIRALEKLLAAGAQEAASETFRLEGDFWTLAFAGQTVRLRDMRGLHYLAVLLRHPGREIHVNELVALGRNGTSGPDPDLSVVRDLGDAGENLDGHARAQYRARLGELGGEIAEAERWNDVGRLERARAEQETLLGELEAAARTPRAASNAERARLAVTKAIRATLDKIEASHPSLGAHLAATVRRGYFCAYVPDPRHPIEWAG